ncbi:hypothetical protein QNH46_01245 [Paenibacillus woosongensis]|uniref:Butirosin biosynthesis protein H N-terminal domain-containing protein n=1 Tax=Paenibacillus woosongensis TaxID=307580 RepID=A0AA95I889_9BACL|nr:hypothetical protein [Paenibacillus woosongensis]WHX49348.1 hypothetical protein QNH46_01245 [Paenibacillus woosongensis]
MKLSLGDSPVIGYQHHAYRLSIMAQHTDFFNWFYCNYIQLVLVKRPYTPVLDFYEFQKSSPLLGEMYIPKSLITKYTPLIPFLKDRLEEGKYIITFANEYYVPNRLNYQRRHNAHDIFLYGFDPQRDEFHIAGFNENFLYNSGEVSSALMEKALLQFDQSKGDLIEWADGMHFLDLKHSNTFTFDKRIMLEQMEEYLYSRNSSDRFRMYANSAENVFGLAVYDEVIDYLHNLRSHVTDVRIFHILYEHKKVMHARLRFLVENKGVQLSLEHIDRYEQLAKQCLVLRNLCLRLHISKQLEVVERMIKLLDIIKETEKELLQEIIGDLAAQ